jgi:NhaP-type Na+/H+ or K+/H+ antiporter
VGLLGILAWPAAVGASRYSDRVDLIQALIGAVLVGIVFGFGAILLARRARRRIQRTIGRSGGARTAAIGRAVGLLAICAAITGALALGFFGLLQLFAS